MMLYRIDERLFTACKNAACYISALAKPISDQDIALMRRVYRVDSGTAP